MKRFIWLTILLLSCANAHGQIIKKNVVTETPYDAEVKVVTNSTGFILTGKKEHFIRSRASRICFEGKCRWVATSHGINEGTLTINRKKATPGIKLSNPIAVKKASFPQRGDNNAEFELHTDLQILNQGDDTISGRDTYLDIPKPGDKVRLKLISDIPHGFDEYILSSFGTWESTSETTERGESGGVLVDEQGRARGVVTIKRDAEGGKVRGLSNPYLILLMSQETGIKNDAVTKAEAFMATLVVTKEEKESVTYMPLANVPSGNVMLSHGAQNEEQKSWPTLTKSLTQEQMMVGQKCLDRLVKANTEKVQTLPNFLAYTTRRVATLDRSWVKKPMSQMFDVSQANWYAEGDYILRSISETVTVGKEIFNAGEDAYQKAGKKEWDAEPQATPYLWYGEEFAVKLRIIFDPNHTNHPHSVGPTQWQGPSLVTDNTCESNFSRANSTTVSNKSMTKTVRFPVNVVGSVKSNFRGEIHYIDMMYKAFNTNSKLWFCASRMYLSWQSIEGVKRTGNEDHEFLLPSRVVSIIGAVNSMEQPVVVVLDTRYRYYKKFETGEPVPILEPGQGEFKDTHPGLKNKKIKQ